MVIQLLRNIFSGESLSLEGLLFNFVAILAVVFFSLPFHEFAHAFAAKLFGDNTATNMGRLTLNPFKHLDPIGTALIMVAGFGYAKPVPVNPYNFNIKGKPARRLGDIVVSFAGPFSNLLLAIIFMFIFRFAIYPFTYADSTLMIALFQFCIVFIQVNISLAVFNLLPIPPLDGSHILFSLLPPRIAYQLEANAGIFRMVLFAVLLLGVFGNFISQISGFIFNLLTLLFFGINF